jgi:hypothetical protein
MLVTPLLKTTPVLSLLPGHLYPTQHSTQPPCLFVCGQAGRVPACSQAKLISSQRPGVMLIHHFFKIFF